MALKTYDGADCGISPKNMGGTGVFDKGVMVVFGNSQLFMESFGKSLRFPAAT